MTDSILRPIHPGEFLREEFLIPLNMSAADLADRLDVAHETIEDIVAEKAPVTEDIARRLGKHFKTSAEMWIGMQNGYDRKIAARDTDA